MKLRKGPLPLYHQLERALRKRIQSEKLDDNQPFPNERQLCEEYGVSRTTVRQALMILEREGLLSREQGRGTFVTNQDPRSVPPELYGYMDDLFLLGSKTQLEIHSRELVRLDAGTANDLELEEGETAYLFEGVRYLSEKDNCALFRAWVPRAIGERIELAELTGPFFIDTVERVSMERVTRAHQIMSATIATEHHESVMNVTRGSPILVVKRIYFSTTSSVVEVAETHFPGDEYQPMTVLERVITGNSHRFDFEQEASDE